MKVVVIYLVLSFFQARMTEGVDCGGAQFPLGMSNQFIMDSQIRASSTCNCTTHPPEDARYGLDGSWTSAIADEMQFLQIDLEIPHVVTSLKIQGRPDYPQFVRYYNLEFSNDADGYNFDYVPDENNPNIAKDIPGITLDDDIDYATYVASHSNEEHEETVNIGPLRFVRIYPTNWTHHIAMRVELFGCADVDTTLVVDPVTELTPSPATYGETVQLRCVAHGYRAPTITWEHVSSASQITNSPRIQITQDDPVDFMHVTSTLTINYYQEHDNSDYKCTASHDQYLTNALISAEDTISRPDSGALPTLTGVTGDVKFFGNYFYEFSTGTADLATARQHCIDNDGYLAPANTVEERKFIHAFITNPDVDPIVKYWVETSTSSNAVHGLYSGSDLTFSSVTDTDLLRYVCKYGEIVVTHVELDAFPLWSELSFSLLCTVSGNPTPEVKWYKNDIEMTWDNANPPATLLSDHRFEWEVNGKDHTLVINSPYQLDDLTTYKCQADNGYFIDFKEFILPQGALPHLYIRHSGVFEFSAGRDVVLECEAECYPHPQLAWRKGGVDLVDDLPHIQIVETMENATSNVIINYLKIFDLVPEDVGNYSCYVVNQLGQSAIGFEIPEDGDVSDDRDLTQDWYSLDKLDVIVDNQNAVLEQASITMDIDEERSLTDDEITVGEDFLHKVESFPAVTGSDSEVLHLNLRNVLNFARGLIGNHQELQTQPRCIDIIGQVENIYMKASVAMEIESGVNIHLPTADAKIISTVVNEDTELVAEFENYSTMDNESEGDQTLSYADGRLNKIAAKGVGHYLGRKVTFSAIFFAELRVAMITNRRRRSTSVVEPTVSTELNTGVMSCVMTSEGDRISDLPVEYSLANNEDVIAEDIELTQDVGKRLIHTNKITTSKEAMCRYWNYVDVDWDHHGLSLVEEETTELITTCYSTHTTNFAVLMQVTEIEISSTNTKALEIISYIGCGISIATLLFTIILFQWLDTLRSERTTIHKNLIVAIIMAQIVFLAGINATHNWGACMCVAILLHFCYLAVFAWMLVEGIHLYSKVVQVFGSESSKLKYYFLIGWGLPFIIVGISAAANHNGYGTEKHCWLDIASGQIWAFVGPALLIILINLVVLGMVVRIVINSAKMQKEKEYDHIKAGVKGALVLLPLLGLTWVFGLFAVDEGSLVFQYLFAIFNSLQGFFIFLFQCAFNSEVRAAYQRKKEKRALARGEFVTSTSGTHGGYETANRTTKTALTTFSSSDTSDYGRGSPAGLALSRKSSQSSAETLIKDDDSVISTSKVKLKDKHMDTASYKAPSSPLPGTVEEDDDVEIVHC